MKNNIKMISCALAGIMVGGISVVCANQAIQAMQNTEIKVSLNGQVQEFKDETTGERQYPITYNNRTYLPLRNVASLSGLDVNFDSNSNTAVLNSKENDDFYLIDIDGDSQKELIINAHNQKDGGSGLYVFKKEIYTGSSWEKLESSENNIHRNMFALGNVFQTSNGVYIINSTGETEYAIDEISKIEIVDNKYVLTSVFAYEEKNGDGNYYIDGKEVSQEEYKTKREEFEKLWK